MQLAGKKMWIAIGALIVIVIGFLIVMQMGSGADADVLGGKKVTSSPTYNQYTAQACANGQLSKTFCEANGYTWNGPSPYPSLPTADQAYQNCLSGNPSHPELCDGLKPTATPSANPTTTPTATPTAKPTATPTVKPTTVASSTPTTAPTNNYTADACANGQLSQQFCEDNGYTYNAPSPNVSLPTDEEAYQNCLSGNPSHPELCDGLKPTPPSTSTTPVADEDEITTWEWVINFLFGWLKS